MEFDEEDFGDLPEGEEDEFEDFNDPVWRG